MERLEVPQVFVLHVKVGYEHRRRMMEAQLARLGIEFEFILDGDIPDLKPADLKRFTGFMIRKSVRPALSCAVKHLKAYEQIVARQLAGALIFEDDVFLADDFVAVVNRTLTEVATRSDIDPARLFLSYENSSLRFIPRSQTRPGQLLYRTDKTRGAAVYYITHAAAQLILDGIARQPLAEAIDIYHTTLCRAGELPAYWCHPPVAEQGSMNGAFGSSITLNKPGGIVRQVTWSMKKVWKQFVGLVS